MFINYTLNTVSTAAEIEQRIGSEIDQFVYPVQKKNCDAMTQLNEQFGRITKNYRVAHSVSQLNNRGVPAKGIINVIKTISATEDDEVWMELI